MQISRDGRYCELRTVYGQRAEPAAPASEAPERWIKQSMVLRDELDQSPCVTLAILSTVTSPFNA
jgi:hypothetical protein